MIYADKYCGKINNKTILASILVYRSPFDKPGLNRWGLFCHFLDETANKGETLSKIDNSKGDSFTIFPSPYQSGIEQSIVNKAIEFLSLLGFTQLNE